MFYEYGLNPWDIAAGSIIVKEAGGNVSDFKNENNFEKGIFEIYFKSRVLEILANLS